MTPSKTPSQALTDPTTPRGDAQHRNPSQEWLSVLTAAHAVLDQCERFVTELPSQAYTKPSPLMQGGTVGKHLRHLADHYAAILVGLEAGSCIDYDHRERDVPMETDRDMARHELHRLKARVVELSSASHTTPMAIRVMVTGLGKEATLATSLGRELAFATHHAVHHQAMMRAIAGECGASAPMDFGVAPSTIHHELTRTSTQSK
jgi:uncharacterized damage-inducible protein DinB